MANTKGGTSSARAAFSQLDVEQHPLVLVHVYLPVAVLALAVPLGPVWGEDHTSWTREVAPTLRCRERQRVEFSPPQKTHSPSVWADVVDGPDTFAKRLRVVPVRIPGADALDDRGPLFQGVARVAGELDHGPHAVERVAGGEVAVLEVRLVAVAALKRWRRKRQARRRSEAVARTRGFGRQRQRWAPLSLGSRRVILAKLFQSICLKIRHKCT